MGASKSLIPVPLMALSALTHDADFAAWLDGHRASNTRRAYAADLQQFMTYLREAHPDTEDLRTITVRHLIGYPRWLHDEHGYSPASIRRKLSSVKSICAYLTALGVWPTSPAATVRGYRVPNTSPRTALTGPEARSLLEAAREDVRDYAILLTLATLALRRSEVANMRCGDISRREGHVALHILGKHDSDAYLPIPPHVGEAIRAYSSTIGREVEDVVALHALDSSPIFLPRQVRKGREGVPMHPGQILRIVQHWGAVAGLTLDAHTLRHTAITLALDKGGSLRRVQAMARHRDPRTTTRYDSRAGDLHESAVYLVRYDT